MNFQLFMGLFCFGANNYEDHLNDIYESVQSNRDNYFGHNCVVCVTMETNHNDWRYLKLHLFFHLIVVSFILKCVTLNLSMVQTNATTNNSLRFYVVLFIYSIVPEVHK